MRNPAGYPAGFFASAHTPGGYGGVPQSVGKDFTAADKAKKLGKLLKASK